MGNRVVVLKDICLQVCSGRIGFVLFLAAWLCCSGSRAEAQGAAPVGAPAVQAGPTPGVVRNQTSQGNQTTQQTNTQRPSTTNPNDANAARDRATGDRRERVSDTVHDVPTEFQRLVTASTGSLLPIFGADLFNNVPSTFAPVDDVPVAPDYVVGPGDTLRIEVYGQVNQQGSFGVDRSGDIAYPDVGTIHVAGVRYADLPAVLRGELGRVYRNFQLNVTLGQLRSIQVFVTGYARRPGSYTVSSLSTLLNAIFASGGPLPQGSLRNIELIRGSTTLTHFDLYDLLLHGDKSKDLKLEPGDVIFIPAVGPQVAIAGSVNNPAIYEIQKSTTVTEGVMLAGGRTSVALGALIRLDRIFQHTMRSITDVDLAKGQNPTLEEGDIVTVATILDRYKDAVTLAGQCGVSGPLCVA